MKMNGAFIFGILPLFNYGSYDLTTISLNHKVQAYAR